MVDSAVTRQHVLAAIHECDEVGQDEFLGLYGSDPSPEYVLRHANNSYDSKAILGAAIRKAKGAAATPEEYSGSRGAAASVLRELDFEVLSPQKADTAEAVPTTSIPNQRRTNGIEPVVEICPKCFLALTAAGACDNCD